MEAQTRRNCTTVVNHLLVSGDCDTVSRQTFGVRKYAKASGFCSESLERERCRAWRRTVGSNPISYIRIVFILAIRRQCKQSQSATMGTKPVLIGRFNLRKFTRGYYAQNVIACVQE